jgi:membrane-associated protease RseP (regulator of RpoE activity)
VSSYEARLQQQIDLIGKLRQELEDLLHVSDVRASARGDAVVFVGRLAPPRDAETAYRVLRERFASLGYTPVLRREGSSDIVVAHRGIVRGAYANPIINLVLFAATLFTTMMAGATIAGVNIVAVLRALLNGGNPLMLVPVLAAGAPFAGTLLFILGVHEMGHYVAARIHRVHVTLPYFIPVPFGLGTFGAFIQMRSPVENRKALFDVGVAGPLAGFVVALPLMIAGLLQSQVMQPEGVRLQLGMSLLVEWLVDLFIQRGPQDAIVLSPMAIAAWFGLLVTGFNLLPMGQLDGGHIAYAVFGRFARPLALLTFLGMLLLGYMVWVGWYTWAFFAFITGLRHPQPLNDITGLSWPRRLLGLLTLGLFFLLVTPQPFTF